MLLMLGDALTSGIVIAGDELVGTWRAQLTPYPRALAQSVVRRHEPIDHFWRWRMYAERDEPLRLQVHFAEVAEHIVHVGCALSGMWWPGAKRPAGTAARLTVAPPDLAARLRHAAVAPAPDAAALLESLVEESYDLVAQHIPEVDVTRLREIFRFVSNAW